MLGAIIGDIVGSRWEFNPTNDYNFPLFSDKNSFTDDTICTVAVADALLHGSDDYGKYIHKWCRKYPHPMGGYGGRFAKWVASDNPQPYNSFGNGSAMRVSPVGWMFETPGDLYEQAKKSAECTHNHEEGILGAQAVAFAIRDCRVLRQDMKGKEITEEDILIMGIDHAVMLYYEWPQNFKLDISKCVNKFDETCQGTVPVALWIIQHSKSFEDAIRQAVALGADADTLGAIVGSIAEALWGIPEWIKEKALSYLPQDMKDVIMEFHKRLNRLRKLTKKCQYYLVGDFNPVDEKNQKACDIEREWAHDLARSYSNADKMKAEMEKRCAMEHWQKWADDYDLPVSLIGYIFKHTADSGMFMHECVEPFEKFLRDNYSVRIPQAEKKKEEKMQKEHVKAMMFWKLSLGNPNNVMFGNGSPLPDKKVKATADSWKTEPMPNNDDASDYELSIPLAKEDLDILRMGHIPEAQEDHWFMYTDNEYIRYFRSWTGMCAFEAHYSKDGSNYRIDHLRMNKNLCEFGVNGDEAGAWLFRYLVTAEIGADAEKAWQAYLNAWEMLHEKYKKK